jgi:hypothetical protein
MGSSDEVPAVRAQAPSELSGHLKLVVVVSLNSSLVAIVHPERLRYHPSTQGLPSILVSKSQTCTGSSISGLNRTNQIGDNRLHPERSSCADFGRQVVEPK